MDSPTAVDGVLSVSCSDVDEAREVGRDVFHPHRLGVAPSVGVFEMRLRAASLGPMTVGVLGYGAETHIDTDDLGAYQVNVPLSGVVTSSWGEQRVVADAGTAAVYGPRGRTSFRGFTDGDELVGLKVERAAVEGELETLLGRRLPGPLEVAPTMDIATGRGADWWRLVRTLVDLLESPAGLLDTPIVVRPLAHSIVLGLLFALVHPYLDDLVSPAPRASSPIVRRAVELLEESADEPLTIGDVARHVGSSVRALQVGFQRDLATTPMTYLRDVRLRRAHADLLAAAPEHETVGAIARRWGFAHLGRFATAHVERFGSRPSDALHART